jgi:hypothetical protein
MTPRRDVTTASASVRRSRIVAVRVHVTDGWRPASSTCRTAGDMGLPRPLAEGRSQTRVSANDWTDESVVRERRRAVDPERRAGAGPSARSAG